MEKPYYSDLQLVQLSESLRASGRVVLSKIVRAMKKYPTEGHRKDWDSRILGDLYSSRLSHSKTLKEHDAYLLKLAGEVTFLMFYGDLPKILNMLGTSDDGLKRVIELRLSFEAGTR